MGVPGTSGLPKVPTSVLSTESTIIELKLKVGNGPQQMIMWFRNFVQMFEFQSKSTLSVCLEDKHTMLRGMTKNIISDGPVMHRGC